MTRSPGSLDPAAPDPGAAGTASPIREAEAIRTGARAGSTAAVGGAPRRRPWLGLALLYAAILAAIVVPPALRPEGLHGFLGGMDFRAYFTAGRLVLEGHRGDFYDLATQYRVQHAVWPEMAGMVDLMGFFNPPFAALPLAAVAIFPPETAYVLWAAVNVGLLLALLGLVGEALEAAPRRARRWATALTLLFFPVLLAILHGQLSLVLALALMLAWRQFRLGQDRQGGLALALLLLKPQLVLFPLLILLLKRRWQALLGFALGAFAALILSLLAVGLDGLLGYVRLLGALPSLGDAYGLHPQRLHTWRGLLHLIFATDDPGVVQLPWLLGAGVITVTLLLGWRGRWVRGSPRFDLQWALLALALLLASPHLYTHDLAILVVPSVLVVRAALGPAGADRRGAEVWLPALLFVAVTAWLAVSNTAAIWLPLPALAMALALFLLARRLRQPPDGAAAAVAT